MLFFLTLLLVDCSILANDSTVFCALALNLLKAVSVLAISASTPVNKFLSISLSTPVTLFTLLTKSSIPLLYLGKSILPDANPSLSLVKSAFNLLKSNLPPFAASAIEPIAASTWFNLSGCICEKSSELTKSFIPVDNSLLAPFMACIAPTCSFM